MALSIESAILCYNILMTKTKKAKIRPWAMPAVMRFLLSTVFLILIAILFAWFIEYRRQLQQPELTAKFIARAPGAFWFSAVIVFLILATISAILWRPFLGAGVTFALISIITYIHMQKFDLRAAPLVPEDFLMAGNAGDLLPFIDVWSIVRLIVGVIFVLIGSGLLEHYARRTFGYAAKDAAWWERWALIPRITLTVVSLTALVLTSHSIFRHESDAPEWLGTRFSKWNQIDTYDRNGFVIGFLYNLGSAVQEPPEGYNSETIHAIAERLLKAKAADEARLPLDQVVDNIILVMNESFYDSELLSDDYVFQHIGGDPLPNLRKIFQKYPSGYMYSPEYGGNTANVEFAAMTGLSTFWTKTIPYTDFAAKISRLPGLTSFAKENGFAATAVHAYDGSMYKRNAVYERMGYDEFIDSNKMTHQEVENKSPYINDKSVYQDILDVLNDGEKKHMIGAVTMQNHTPYNSAFYDDIHYAPVNRHDWSPHLENYYESIHNGDQYLGEFIAELDKLEGKTIMIWFGDHAPGLMDWFFGSEDVRESTLSHLTPYFVYANFEIKSPWTVREVAKINQANLGFDLGVKNVDLPTVTPNCLANIVYDILGAEKPALAYLNAEVCSTTPILAQTYFKNEEPSGKALRDYELINYDFAHGKRYWLEYVQE